MFHELIPREFPQVEPAEIERRLNQYLECEALLKQFFRQVDYCRPNCITQSISRYSKKDEIPGIVGCCSDDAYMEKHNPSVDFAPLEQRRRLKYGLPENQESEIQGIGRKPCRYHTIEGCVLEDYKPPICVSYVCGDFVVYLANTFGIVYDWKNVCETMANILDGQICGAELEKFKQQLNIFVEQTKTRKEQQHQDDTTHISEHLLALV